MRKLTIEIEPNEDIRKHQRVIFENIHSYEILETLKVDPKQGMCIDLIECQLKEHRSINELRSIGMMEILNVIRSEGSKHLCLTKYYEEEGYRELFQEFDLDLIASKPTILSEKKYVSSVIGDQKELLEYVQLIREHIGNVLNMSFSKPYYQKGDVLSILTDKQRDVLITAQKLGYYDYPKRTSSERLAERMDLSRGTLLEHLRKAEGRIFAELVTGY